MEASTQASRGSSGETTFQSDRMMRRTHLSRDGTGASPKVGTAAGSFLCPVLSFCTQSIPEQGWRRWRLRSRRCSRQWLLGARRRWCSPHLPGVECTRWGLYPRFSLLCKFYGCLFIYLPLSGKLGPAPHTLPNLSVSNCLPVLFWFTQRLWTCAPCSWPAGRS